MTFPAFHKILEYQQTHNRPSLEWAIVKKGMLYVSCEYLVVRADLSLYLRPDAIRALAGKALDSDALQMLFSGELTPFDVKNLESLPPCTGTFRAKDHDTKIKQDYSYFFEDSARAEYPYAGINSESLALVANCFKQSMQGSFDVSIEFKESEGLMYQKNKPFIIRPATPYDSTKPDAEIAVLSPVNMLGLDHLEDII